MRYIFFLIPAIILTVLNSAGYLAGVIRTAPGEVYLGTTHYFEDYYLYLSQFRQGAGGAWLTRNLYTSEPTQESILFWPNILLGKIGGAVGLDPAVSYNLSVLFLSFGVLIILGVLMGRVYSRNQLKAWAAFLFAGTATSLMNRIRTDGLSTWYPFQQWKTPNFALDRLGGVPHQTVQTLAFLLALYALFYVKRRAVALTTIILLLLSTINPVMSAIFLGALWLSRKPGKGMIVMTVVVAAGSWYYSLLTDADPHRLSRMWEATQQSAATPLFMLLSVGPVSALGIIGAWIIIRLGARPVERFCMVLLLLSYFLYFSPIPSTVGISNSRVLFPALYAAWGIVAAAAIPVNRRFASVIVALYLLATIPTIRWETAQKLSVKPEERVPLLYLPATVYGVFEALRQTGAYDETAIGNPQTHMDALIPAFGGHRTYSGHPFATVDNDRKRSEATRFFRMTMTAEEAIRWMKNNAIVYSVFTKFDGNVETFRSAYPFLRAISSSADATLFSNKQDLRVSSFWGASATPESDSGRAR